VQLGDRARLGVPVELTDPTGALVVRHRQDVEQFGARRGTEGIEAIAKQTLDILQVHIADAGTCRGRGRESPAEQRRRRPGLGVGCEGHPGTGYGQGHSSGQAKACISISLPMSPVFGF
jgi:hypothetical protein